MKKNIISVYITLILVGIIPSTISAGANLSNDVVWVKRSDEYKCCVAQAYLDGMERLRRLAKDKKRGTWCVTLDADETIISNIAFQATGLPYSAKRWDEWSEKSVAVLLPGGKEFCSLVRELGGKVIIITNRKGHLQKVTEKNLQKLDFPYDVLLTRTGIYADDRTKVMRRAAVESGTIKTLPAGMELPPLEIVMLVGDQTHDLYDVHKFSFDDVKGRFGEDLVIIPNPIYGSWSSPPMAPEPFFPHASSLSQVREDAPKVTSRGSSEFMTPEEAMNRVGENVTVQATISSIYDPVTRGKNGPVKLNTGQDWKNGLTIVLFNKDGSFGDPQRFEGKEIRATGEVGTYRDKVQLIVAVPEDIEIIEK